ncbi:oxygenase MpaB family protein [Monashia sp. NPDC004114]
MSAGAALRGVQRHLGMTLRSKVAGEDASARAQRIWGAEGERWFGPSDPIWRVHADAAMFSGGVASLLMQSLHPLAMAGVVGHSGYKGDPWGRLQRTSNYLATTTYGTVEQAEEAIAAVQAIHERVRGRDPVGRPYRASDPHLLLWVHVAEVDSFLRAYRAFGASPLSDAEADRYVEQAGTPARMLGVVDPPRTVAGLAEVLDRYRPELEATSGAREAARFLLLDPPLPVWARPGYGVIAAGGVSLLPGWARSMLGLPVPEVVARCVGRPLGRFGAGTVRWGLAGLETRRPSDPHAA